MKLKYYGTSAGGGIPEIFCSCRICEHARKYKGKNIRTRSQAMLDDVLAIEYPVDTLAHTAYLGLDLRKVRHILITHGHHDHYLPEDIFSRPQGENWPVHFYCSEFTAAKLQKTIDGTEADFASGRRTRTCDYRVAAHALIPYQTTEILDYKITPLRARHAEAIGAMIFIIQKGDKSILWAQDTGKFHPDAMEYIQNSGLTFDFISMDCTLKRGAQLTQAHMDMDWCIEMVEQMRQSGNVDEHTTIALSHIGHLVERTHEELEQEAAEHGMIVAYDGMEIEI
ncbi:MAG: hypothetical protein IJC46_06700 [Clostridia bacterium]|nr:hypothetical protein [Clostridia bacterium]